MFKMNLRERCLAASSIFGLIIFLGTEMLSAFRLLVPAAIVILWGLVLLVLLFIVVRRKELLFQRVGLNFLDLSRYEMFIMVSLVVMALALFVQGYFSAPNTADSMTYHLTRVMHWAQDHHIGFYAAHKERQLWMPPWAEYAVLHLYFLAGSDRLAFLVQWGAYGGCLIAASLIARHLGGNRLVQLAAAALCATIPIVILESVSTQTDLIATFWLMNAVVWLLAWQKNGQRPVDACCGAVALGLAILTKTSMLLFAAPFVAGMMVFGVRARRFRATFLALCLMVLMVAVLSGPHLLRVWQGFGTLNPVSSEVRLTNEMITFPVFVSNALKSVALNLTTPSQRLNNAIKGFIHRAHVLISVDEDDPRTNLAPGSGYLKKEHVFYESRAPNTLPMFLGFMAVIAVLVSFRIYGPVAVSYALCLVAGSILLIMYMKWQPWATRFQLTLFALAAPLAALVLGQLGKERRLLKSFTLLCLVAGVPWIIWNVSHPFVGESAFYRVAREEQYFIGMPQERAFFHAAVKEIEEKDCSRVGLDLPHEDAWEYPLWPLLRAKGLHPEIRSIHVRGKSSVHEDLTWEPCVIIGHQGSTP